MAANKWRNLFEWMEICTKSYIEESAIGISLGRMVEGTDMVKQMVNGSKQMEKSL
jgi:hypothetical protein